MASYLFTAPQVADLAVAGLDHMPVIANLFNREASKHFVSGSGGAVVLKRPVIADPARVYDSAARQANAAITYSDLLQPSTALQLDDQVYNAVKLPDDVATFTVEDMGREVVQPMARSVAERVESIAADVLNSIPAGLTDVDEAAKGALVHSDGTVYDTVEAYLNVDPKARNLQGTGVGLTADEVATFEAGLNPATDDANDLLKAMVTAKQVFDARKVPTDRRTFVIGSGWELPLLLSPVFQSADRSGSTTALRQATLGTVFGFTVVVSGDVPADTAFAIQRDFATLATAVTAPPRGAAFSATATANGYTLRYLHDYDADHLTDRAVVDLFAGAALLDGQRALRMQIGATPAA